MASSINTSKHAVRGFFRFNGLITSDPAVYARLPKSTKTNPAPKDSTASN